MPLNKEVTELAVARSTVIVMISVFLKIMQCSISLKKEVVHEKSGKDVARKCAYLVHKKNMSRLGDERGLILVFIKDV